MRRSSKVNNSPNTTCIVVKENTQSDDINNTQCKDLIWKIIHRYVKLLRIVGAYMHLDSDATRQKRILKLYSYLAILYRFQQTFSFFIFFKSDDTFGEQLFHKVTVVLLYLSLALCTVFGIFSGPHVELVLDQWKNSSYVYPDSFYTQLRRKLLLIQITYAIVITVCVVGGVAFNIYIFANGDVYAGYPNYVQTYLPFWSQTWPIELQYVLYSLGFVFTCFSILVCWTIAMVLTNLVIIVRANFKQLTLDLTEHISHRDLSNTRKRQARVIGNGTPEVHHQALEEYRLQHDVICQMVEHVNDGFTLFNGYCLVYAVLEICLALFTVTRGFGNGFNLEYILSVVSIGAALVMLGNTLMCGVLVNDPVS